jgi:hypothetical protein
MPFELTDNVHVDRDEQGNVQHLEHLQQPFVAVNVDEEAARHGRGQHTLRFRAYASGSGSTVFAEVMPIYDINENLLPDPGGAEARQRNLPEASWS